MANTDPDRANFGALPTFGGEQAIAGTTGESNYNDGEAQATSAKVFGDLSTQLGGIRAQVDQDQGTREGKIAGAQPGYQPDDDESVRGRAFRNAAVATQANMTEANARQQVSDAYSTYMDLPQDQRQPSVLQKNLAGIKQDFLANHVLPEQQGAFNVSYAGLSQTYLKSAQDDLDKRTADQAKAAVIVNANTTADTAHRIAAIPGPAADAQLGQQVDSYNKLIDAAVNDDTYTASQAATMKENFKQGVLRTRVLAQFTALPDAQKPAFAQSFAKAYGTGGGLVNDKADDDDADIGTRNNNFANITDGSFAKGQPGYAGADGRFAKFATPEAGLKAADANLQSYAAKGVNTVAGIVNRWSPPSENQTSTLITSMAQRMGVSPNAALDMSDPSVRAKLVQGLVQQETGKTPYSVDQVQGAITGNATRGLSPQTYDYVTAHMGSQLRQVNTLQNQQQRAALNDIDAAQKQVTAGYDVPQAQWSALQQKYGASTDPAVSQAFGTADTIRTMFASFKGQSPSAISADIAKEQAKDAGGYSPQQVEVLQAATTYLGKLRTDLASDPIGRAAREGVVTPAQVDPSSPASLAQSLSGRIPVAEAAAAHYGLPAPVYLRPDERAAFKTIAAQGGPNMVAAAGAMASTLGTRADAVLKEIGGDAPKFAAAARLAAWNADPGLIDDLAERQRLNNDPTAKGSLELPAKNASDQVFSNVYGDAMSAVAGMNAASRQTAKDVYEVRALRDNLDKGVGTTASVDALTRTAQQAAGATFDGNQQYGGVAAYNTGFFNSGHKILAPLDMRADGVSRAISTLTDADLKALPAPPVAADLKTPVSAATIAGSNLKSQGHGVYWVARGDPNSANPKWVMTPAGQKFTLDLNKLGPQIRARAPDLYRSGS